MSYTYIAYDLIVSLPFPCPMLQRAPDGCTPDLVVEEGCVTKNLAMAVMKENNWQIEPGRFLLRGGLRSGRFLVENGSHITLERNPLAEDERLAVHFMATALPVLLQQRGDLILHANTVVTPDGAIAISGKSGAGKTTTVAALLRKGCTLLADDITMLRQNENKLVEVVPGPPQLHLCEETANMFGYDISGLPRYPWRRMKAAVPVHNVMAFNSVPLKKIYLIKISSSDEVRVTSLVGKEKFAALQESLYGPLIPDEQSKLFALHSVVLDSVEICCIERPHNRWCLDEVVEVILHG